MAEDLIAIDSVLSAQSLHRHLSLQEAEQVRLFSVGSFRAGKSRLWSYGMLFLFALFVFMSLVAVLNVFQLKYYATVNRLTLTKTVSIFFVSHSQDWLFLLILSGIVVVSPHLLLLLKHMKVDRQFFLTETLLLPSFVLMMLGYPDFGGILLLTSGLLSLILAMARFEELFGVPTPQAMALFFSCLIGILVFIEISSLARWLFHPLFPSMVYNDPSWSLSLVELQLFFSGSVLCPLLLLLIVFALLVRPVAELYVSSMRNMLHPLMRKTSAFGRLRGVFDLTKVDFELGVHLGSPFVSRVMMVSALAVGLALAIYPYSPGVNPGGRYVGVDIPRYRMWLHKMLEESPIGAVSYAFFEGRPDTPFSLLFHYFVQRVTNLPAADVAKYMHVLLLPLFVFSVYFFTKRAAKSERFASVASLLAAVSYTTTVGMYAGLLANWLALTLVYLSVGFLLEALDRRSNLFLGLCLLTSVSTLFAHPWTWGVLVACLAFYLVWLGVRFWRGREVRSRHGLIVVAVIIVVNIGVDILKDRGLNVGSGIAAESDVAASKLGLGNFLRFWPNILFSFRYYMGGYFTNPLSWVLATIGVYLLMRVDRPYTRIVLSWLTVTALPIVFGNFVAQSRLLYILPLDFLSALGLCSVWEFIEGSGNRERKVLAYLFALFVLLVYLNYGFRSAANLVFKT